MYKESALSTEDLLPGLFTRMALYSLDPRCFVDANTFEGPTLLMMLPLFLNLPGHWSFQLFASGYLSVSLAQPVGCCWLSFKSGKGLTTSCSRVPLSFQACSNCQNGLSQWYVPTIHGKPHRCQARTSPESEHP